MRILSTSPSLFRLLLIGLLLITMLVKPVLAFDCAIADAPQQAAEQDRSPGSADASDWSMGDDGCPFQDCHDCCAHTTAVLPTDRLPSFAQQQVATIPLPAAMPFRPHPLLTVFRPPIAC